MITYVKGNLFSSPAQVLVNTVNTVGVMGKGIAKEFKAIYPEMFREYQVLCESGELVPGKLFLYRTTHKWVLNFPTKRHWRQTSRVADIEAGLDEFVRTYRDLGIHSIAFPQLGCGNGELDWESQVRPLMERYLAKVAIDVYVHTYDAAVLPEQRQVAAIREWLRSEPRSLPVSEVWDDLIVAVERESHLTLSEIASEGDDGEEFIPAFTPVTDHDEWVFSRDDLVGLWQNLREWGYITGEDLSPIGGRGAKAVMDLIAALPYVEPVAFVPLNDVTDRSVPTSHLLNDDLHVGLRLKVEEGRRGPEPLTLTALSDRRQLCLNEQTLVRLPTSSRS